MFNDLLETVKIEETIGDHKIAVTARAATWADMTALEETFLSLVYSAISKAPGNMFGDMDKVIKRLCTVEVDGKKLDSIDELPVTVVLKISEAVIEANFTASNVSAWQSFFNMITEKIATMGSEAESAPTK